MKHRHAIIESILIWVFTCLLGSIFHWINGAVGLSLFEVIAISLVFSLPALVFLIPNFYVLHSLTGKYKRVAYALASILILSLIVIYIFLEFTKGYHFPDGLLIVLLLPYMLSAELSFFLIARKLILAEARKSFEG